MQQTSSDGFFSFFARYAKFQAGLTGAAAVVSVFGTGPLMELLALQRTPASELMMRAFGASFLFVCLAHYRARATRDLNWIRAILMGNLLEDGLLFILSVAAILTGTFGPMAWALAIVFGGEAMVAAVVLSQLRQMGKSRA